MSNIEPVNRHNADDSFSTVLFHQQLLVLVCGGFIVHLLLPKGVRKHYFDAMRRRYARSDSRRSASTNLSETPWTPSNFVTEEGFIWNRVNPLLKRSTRPKAQLGLPPAASFVRSHPTGVCSPRHSHRVPENVPRPHSTEAASSPNSVSLADRTEHTRVLILVSSAVADSEQCQNRQNAQDLLNDKKVPFETVDEVDEPNHEWLEHLHSISGVKGIYPLFFFITSRTAIQYLGDYHTLKKIHHAEGLTLAVCHAHEIATWGELFSFVDTSQIFGV